MAPCGPSRDWLMCCGWGGPICEGARKHGQGACETLETRLLDNGVGETVRNSGARAGESVKSHGATGMVTRGLRTINWSTNIRLQIASFREGPLFYQSLYHNIILVKFAGIFVGLRTLVDKLGISVHNLAGSHHNYHSPLYRVRGHHPLASAATHVDSTKSRLFAPTKSSAAQTISRDPDDPEQGDRRVQLTSHSVSRSVSPKKEVVTTRLPESTPQASSSAVATRTRQGLKNPTRAAPSLADTSRGRKPRSNASQKPLNPVTTLETAHTTSPRELAFRTSSTFEVDPPLRGPTLLGLNLTSSRPPSPMGMITTTSAGHSDSPADLPLPDSGEASWQREIQEGMERGFALSPMADLVRAYNSHTDEEFSLFRRVNSLASKKALDISEVVDRGVSIFAQPIARFGLKTGFLLRTDHTIKEMQSLLTEQLR
ncbi:hypothetical protein B0H13DRAFT_1906566 [Mycena leptocephala]|nr:hypothetical protein B0H13DRAFT_1906566 [Mycena leptocephala]